MSFFVSSIFLTKGSLDGTTGGTLDASAHHALGPLRRPTVVKTPSVVKKILWQQWKSALTILPEEREAEPTVRVTEFYSERPF
jgi:hypothetical protein